MTKKQAKALVRRLEGLQPTVVRQDIGGPDGGGRAKLMEDKGFVMRPDFAVHATTLVEDQQGLLVPHRIRFTEVQ